MFRSLILEIKYKMNSKVFVFLILLTTSYRISLAQRYNATDNEQIQPTSSNTEKPRTTSQSEYFPKWVSYGGKVPLGAVEGGIDGDSGTLYVARAVHDTEIIPGKLNALTKRAYVGNNGIEYVKTSFEVLVGCEEHWERSRENHFPPNAIIAGVAYDGAYYVCRVRLRGNLTNGKMHSRPRSRHSRCYIPYAGTEHTYKEYEILCCSNYNPDSILS